MNSNVLGRNVRCEPEQKLYCWQSLRSDDPCNYPPVFVVDPIWVHLLPITFLYMRQHGRWNIRVSARASASCFVGCCVLNDIRSHQIKTQCSCHLNISITYTNTDRQIHPRTCEHTNYGFAQFEVCQTQFRKLLTTNPGYTVHIFRVCHSFPIYVSHISPCEPAPSVTPSLVLFGI